MSEVLEIPLTRGQVALVDAADHAWLAGYRWHAMWCRHIKGYYAVRTARIEGQRRALLMHRVVLGLGVDDKRFGDHVNRNTLDNRRSNLRIATQAENARNSTRKGKSVFKGVDIHRGKPRARISLDGKMFDLGYFPTREAAARAYNDAAQMMHGEFAVLNEVPA
jgi:hypothetical protein